MDVIELPRVDAVADRDRQPDLEAFLGLRLKRLGIRREEVIARIVQRDAVDEGRDPVDARIERSGPRARDG